MSIREARARACITNWLPRLQSTGVPIPDTRIVEAKLNLLPLLDTGEGLDEGAWQAFLGRLRAAAEEVGGYPCFLRTSHGSGKHEWLDTCHVSGPEVMGHHVGALVEWSAMVDLMGLPTEVWAVRRMLPLVSTFTAFRGFPVNRERRYFIAGGKVRCAHPYWPPSAVEEGEPAVTDWRARLDALNEETPEEVAQLVSASELVSRAFGDEAWSLDWAQATDGCWYAIDMAPAEVSYHWPDCPHARGSR